MNSKSDKVIIIDPALGLSGDMFLSCLFELGAGADKIMEMLESIPGLEPFRIVSEMAEARGIRTARTRVISEEDHHHRNFSGISEMIRESGLERRVADLSLEIFRVIAEAEGKVHGVDPGQVHFHEVGAVDSIVDIVGSVAGLSLLGYPKVYHRSLRLGSGVISIAHGTIPVPAPATIEILRGMELEISEDEGELVTPTGAALIKVLSEPLPEGCLFKPERIVYGSGTREKNPGFLRMMEVKPKGIKNTVRVVRTTIDDMNPELFGYLTEKLFETGVHEVFLNNVIMKKGRPGVELTVICDCNIEDRVLEVLFAETTTLGIRITDENRVELKRWSEPVNTRYGEVVVKFRELPDGSVNFSPEYESAARLARSSGIPLENVFREAAAAAIRRVEENDGN